MKLSQVQEALWRAITERGESQSPAVERLVAVGPRLGPEHQVEIYSQMYFARLLDSLREDFPKLALLLGEESFRELGAAYLQGCPSRHPSLGRFGQQMAMFLAEHRPQAAARPDLADLAALEWARAEVFVELDAAVLEGSALAQIPAEVFPQVRFRLIPAMRVLSLRHEVLGVWRALENGEAVAEPRAGPAGVLVWRRGWVVYHAPIDADEAQALRWAQQGRILGKVCEAFAEREAPAEVAFRAVTSWASERLISAIDPPAT